MPLLNSPHFIQLVRWQQLPCAKSSVFEKSDTEKSVVVVVLHLRLCYASDRDASQGVLAQLAFTLSAGDDLASDCVRDRPTLVVRNDDILGCGGVLLAACHYSRQSRACDAEVASKEGTNKKSQTHTTCARKIISAHTAACTQYANDVQ